MAKAHRPDLRDALEEFRSTGHMSAAVRPEIAASWQRSMAFDLRPDRFEVPYEPEPRTDDERLERAARPVMDRLVEDLGSASMGVILADRHGQILDRVSHDRILRARLDRIMAAPGFYHHERHVGTNAIGIALEQRAPSMVLGTEHFVDALTPMACAAAPIFDPTTGSVLGAIDLTCSMEGSQSLMLALAKWSARLTEHRLVSANPAADRVLLECFLRARRGARGPLVALNAHAMHTNAPAVRLVHDVDRAELWDLVSSALFDQQRAALELPVPLGGLSYVSCETIADGGDVIGALLRFLPEPLAADALLVAPERRRPSPIPGWESLTKTERSIADLVSEGRTNREIAASTFLSHHTVGYHLRHIFDKLGVDSRVELTRLVVQRGRLAS
jgi:DNA-binding CsgD family transcriptional regulator